MPRAISDTSAHRFVSHGLRDSRRTPGKSWHATSISNLSTNTAVALRGEKHQGKIWFFLAGRRTFRINTKFCGYGGLEVACWHLVYKFAGSNTAEAVGFFRAKKILSTPFFGKEVKRFVACRILAACKRTRKCMRGGRSFRSKLPAISRPSSSSFHY